MGPKVKLKTGSIWSFGETAPIKTDKWPIKCIVIQVIKWKEVSMLQERKTIKLFLVLPQSLNESLFFI